MDFVRIDISIHEWEEFPLHKKIRVKELLAEQYGEEVVEILEALDRGDFDDDDWDMDDDGDYY